MRSGKTLEEVTSAGDQVPPEGPPAVGSGEGRGSRGDSQTRFPGLWGCSTLTRVYEGG